MAKGTTLERWSQKRAIGALCNLEKEVVSEMLQEQLLLLRPCRTASSETMRCRGPLVWGKKKRLFINAYK